MSTFRSTLEAEAAQLRSKLDVQGLAAAEARLAEAQAAFDAGDYVPGLPNAERTAKYEAMQRAATERDRIRYANQGAADRLRELDRLLGADARHDAAVAAIKAAKADEQRAAQRVADGAAAIEKMRQMLADEQAAASAARSKLSSAVLKSLGDALGDFAPAPDADLGTSTGTPEFHSQRAQAIEHAIDRAEQSQQSARDALEATRQAVKAATVDWFEARAAQAELANAEALADYLPSLIAYLAAHEAAFDVRPAMPNLEVLAADAVSEASMELRTQAGQMPTGSLIGSLRRMFDRLGLRSPKVTA